MGNPSKVILGKLRAANKERFLNFVIKIFGILGRSWSLVSNSVLSNTSDSVLVTKMFILYEFYGQK